MITRSQKFYLFILPLLLGAVSTFAQAEQESPFQVNETVTKGEGGLGSTVWIIAGIVLLLLVFILLRRGGTNATRAGNPK